MGPLAHSILNISDNIAMTKGSLALRNSHVIANKKDTKGSMPLMSVLFVAIWLVVKAKEAYASSLITIICNLLSNMTTRKGS